MWEAVPEAVHVWQGYRTLYVEEVVSLSNKIIFEGWCGKEAEERVHCNLSAFLGLSSFTYGEGGLSEHGLWGLSVLVCFTYGEGGLSEHGLWGLSVLVCFTYGEGGLSEHGLWGLSVLVCFTYGEGGLSEHGLWGLSVLVCFTYGEGGLSS